MKFMDNTVRSAKKGRAIGIGALVGILFFNKKITIFKYRFTSYRKQSQIYI